MQEPLRICYRLVQSPWPSPDIVLCGLQIVQEGQESIAGFIAPRFALRQG